MATLKYLDRLNQTWKYASVGQQAYVDQQIAAVRAYAPSRNRIINGDFSVNQRGFTSGGGGGTWSADRWRCWSVDGTTTQYVVAATPGELPESARQYMRLVSSGQSAALCSMLLRQTLENVRTLSGKTVTISFWAKAASGTPKVGVSLTQVFGAGGSTDVATPNNVSVTISTTWTRYSVTVTLPSLTGKTIGTDSYVSVDLWTSAGTLYANLTNIGVQNTDVSFWGVQVEEGSVATPYEQKTYADELRACQRYFIRYRQGGGATRYCFGVAASAAEWSGIISLPTAMRTTPTIAVSGTLGLSSTVALDMNPVNTPSVYAVTQQSHDVKTVSLQTSGGTGTLTAYRPYFLEHAGGAGGYIDFSAEL